MKQDQPITVSANQRVKKWKKKKREKKLSKVNMTVIPIVIGALGLIPKDLIKVVEELEIGGQA